ncbi:MAG: L,D-transpeptidase [Bdellovibrionales bacterium]
MNLAQLSIPLIVSGLLYASPSYAIFGWLADITNSGCTWNEKDPNDAAVLMHERLSTPLPKGLNRKVIPFQEADFKKPWIRSFEYVIVVNNSSPYVHHQELPQPMPFITEPLIRFGIEDVTRFNAFQNSPVSPEESQSNAEIFLSRYASEANKVKSFGELVYERNSRGERVPKKSGLKEAQTIRIYRNGQLIRMAQISTGRGSFQKRGRRPHCEQPFESYHTFTEPGYYTFQDLIKDYKSKSYDADMPNSLFYNVGRGLALHEVSLDAKIATLGAPASGGCTRMDPDTAESLYEAVLATENSTIPVIDIYGRPVLDANGQLTYKNSEEVVYAEGTSKEKRIRTGKAYNALLVIQPDPVADANPDQDRSARFRFRR